MKEERGVFRSPATPNSMQRGCSRAIVGWVVLGLACTGLAASGKKKLTVENVMNLLSAGVNVQRVGFLIRERGVDFQLSAQLQQAFVDAGADHALIRAMEEPAGPGAAGFDTSAPADSTERQEAPAPAVTPKPAPSTAPSPSGLPDRQMAKLQIRSQPGGATVWVDNEMKGSTDPEEGRLEISGLPPGKHQLRALREGYEPVEGTVELAAGQALDMPLWLAKSEAPPPATPAPALPEGPKFLVRHKHRAIEGIAPEGFCRGWMVVNVGYVRYISADSPHKYLMNTSEMREAKPASGQGEFRIKLDFGRTYEFTAVDEKGNAVNAAPVLTEIRYSMGQ